MYTESVMLPTLLILIAMSETQSTHDTTEFYLPAMLARPTFGRLESFIKERFGRYGVVRLPYDVLPR